MKKIYLYLSLLVTVVSLGSCSDNEYSDKFNNPSTVTKTSPDKLMTGVFYTARTYTFQSYWRMYTWDNMTTGKFAQTSGFINSQGSLYSVADSYANDRWVNYYKTLAQFRALQDVYNGLPENSKTANRLFVDLAEVFMYDHLSQIVDDFGDVPFTKAGYISISGDLKSSYASYDKATDIYTIMLDRLGELYTDINTLKGSLTSNTSTLLKDQDFVNGGDLDKWERYCNSLRLRLAVRVASQGALSAKGKQVVSEILTGNYPLVSNLDQTIKLDANDNDPSNFFDPDGLRTGYGFDSPASPISWASQAMLDVLTKTVSGENDPRLPIMYSKNAAGKYRGLSTREAEGVQTDNLALANSARVYSRIDSTTVGYNTSFVSPIFTPAEVDFLKAEAYQKGWVAGDAKTAFVNGVLHSAQFYFMENKISPSTGGTKMDIPAESVIKSYAAKAWDAATNKEEVIITQKWLNFGYFQSPQAWNEVRRTGYPQLYYPEDPLAQVFKTVPNRIRYPNAERSYNTANYDAQIQSMGGIDNAYLKIFWAK